MLWLQKWHRPFFFTVYIEVFGRFGVINVIINVQSICRYTQNVILQSSLYNCLKLNDKDPDICGSCEFIARQAGSYCSAVAHSCATRPRRLGFWDFMYPSHSEFLFNRTQLHSKHTEILRNRKAWDLFPIPHASLNTVSEPGNFLKP